MKYVKIFLVVMCILSAGGIIIGEVGAATPAGNVVTFITFLLAYLAGKRVAKSD